MHKKYIADLHISQAIPKVNQIQSCAKFRTETLSVNLIQIVHTP